VESPEHILARIESERNSADATRTWSLPFGRVLKGLKLNFGIETMSIVLSSWDHGDHHKWSWSLMYPSKQNRFGFHLGMVHFIVLNKYLPLFLPFFGAGEPEQFTEPGGHIVLISLPRTEERAQRCYAKAGFEYESSRSAKWGKELHEASEWQKWKKVPTWSVGVPQKNE
jgi:hypothetical protein